MQHLTLYTKPTGTCKQTDNTLVQIRDKAAINILLPQLSGWSRLLY